MKKLRHRSICSTCLAMLAILLPADVHANGNVHVTRFWHNHQPLYWPEWNSNGSQTSRGQYAWDSIVLKPGQNYGGISPKQHPENDLNDIFGKDDRRSAYQYGPRNSLNTFSGGGFALSYSGSLIDNVRQLGSGGHLGYGGDWNSGNTQARQSGRLDLVGFTYHHSLAPLLPKDVFRKELQIFKQAWWKAWGGNSDLSDHSKGFFPTEMAFSESLIDVLVDEGYEWSIVASHHLSRTCPTYFNNFNLEGGQYGIFSTPPNKADLLGPSPTTGWWYSEPNPGNAAWNVSPYAYQLHKVQYVNPETGAAKQMYAVPSDDVLSYRYGYANEGIGKISDKIAPFATDPNRPVIVMPSTDGDNAWGGGSSSWMEATPQYFNEAAGAGYQKNTPGGFVSAAKANAQLVHVEDGAWIFPEMCYGSPNFLKWIEPPLYNTAIGATNRYPGTQADLETPGFALKFFSYAPLMAGANWCITAEQILKGEGGSVQPWKIQAPYEANGTWNNPNDVELAWHIYLKGLDSGFNYYGGLGNDDEVKPALAAKRAIDKLAGYMSTRLHLDQTPPTVLKPQRFPYNPGTYTFGWYNYIPGGDTRYLKKMPSEFYVWTHAYDVNGVDTIHLKVRVDNDGVNPVGSTQNETFAGGGEVGSWITIPMTKRVLPKTRSALNTAAANGQIDYFVFDPAFWSNPVIADYYFVKVTDQNVPGFRGKLLDYYIEATDGRGNIQKSDIQHVYVEHDGGQSSLNPSATFDPAAPSDCAPITVNFNAATSPLAAAAAVNVAYHFSTNTNDWATAAMTRTGSNTFTYTFPTSQIPDNAPQIEVAFNDGGANWANNGGANWKVAIRDCEAPTGPSAVVFDPAAPSGCDPVTIRYYPNEGPLKDAAAVKIHVGRNGWQDTISPDPAMTRNGYAWEYTYVVASNTTAINVCFNNGAGIWDSQNGANWNVSVTNCGAQVPPPPPVSISPTNPTGCGPITITYNPSGRPLQGAPIVNIHIGRNGWKDVVLPNPAMNPSGANWTYVYAPAPGTTNIDMAFNNGASVWDSNGGSDWHFAVAGCAEIPTGLAITNPAADVESVSNAVATFDLAGVAQGMTGELSWTNKLTGASGTIPAAATWTIPGIALDVGGNEIVVVGSNAVASGTATNAIDAASDTAYSGGWNAGNNGGTGFLGWILNRSTNDASKAGWFIGSNATINIGSPAFGLYAQSGLLSEAIRPLGQALGTSATFSVSIENGWILEGLGGIGVALQNDAGDTLWQFWFNGGDQYYNRSGGTTDVTWTDAGIDLALQMTGTATYNLAVQPRTGTVRNYTGSLESSANGQTVTRFRAWSWSNGEGGNYDYFINQPMITVPAAAGIQTHSDFVVVNRQAGGTPPPPIISNVDLHPTEEGMVLAIQNSTLNATYAIYECPDLLAPAQVWTLVPGTQKLGNGETLVLEIPADLDPLKYYRVGISMP